MLYGSDLLGVWKPYVSGGLLQNTYPNFYSRKIGDKQYSIKDHLGNVRVTFADVKIPANGLLQDFVLETQSVSTYYPFGWEIKPLSWAFESFKFGFNGKEKDGQIAGGALDYGARIYSPKIGRWMSTDPLFMKYPSLSSYNYVANNPLKFIDPDGKDIVVSIDYSGEKPKITIIVSAVLADKTNSLSSETLKGYADNIKKGWQLWASNEFKDATVVVESNLKVLTKSEKEEWYWEGATGNESIIYVVENGTVVDGDILGVTDKDGKTKLASFTLGGTLDKGKNQGKFEYGILGYFSLKAFDQEINQIIRTAGHELGHWLGFDHPDEKNRDEMGLAKREVIKENKKTGKKKYGQSLYEKKDNIMFQSSESKSTKTTPEQRKSIIKNSKNQVKYD